MRIRVSLLRMLLAVTLLQGIAGSAVAGSEPGHDELFVVGPYALSTPVGYFVLIRKGAEYGACRFLSAAPVAGGPNTGTSGYESYRLLDKSGSGGWAAVSPRV